MVHRGLKMSTVIQCEAYVWSHFKEDPLQIIAEVKKK